MTLRDLVYRWVDRPENSRIPGWAKALWPKMHWCWEWDGLMLFGDEDEMRFCQCFAGDWYKEANDAE